MNKFFTVLLVIFILGLAIATTYTTIIIDGLNDFESDEDVSGTSGSTYYITWDANYIYLGAQNDNVDDNSSTKFIYFYIDSDPQPVPNTGNGTTIGLTYNTQQPSLPFTANYHFRWKNDNTYTNLQEYNGTSWVDGIQTGISAFQSGQYVEFRIPLTSIGSPGQIHILGAMINEQAGTEWTYYIMPSNNHTDGYDINFSSRFGFTLTTGLSPDDPINIDPIIPVELASFSASVENNSVNLNWKTATELNNYGFDIERKVGSSQSLVNNYEKIGFVSGGGTTTIPQYYYFKDKNLTYGKYSYRLKQIDNDGQFEYSKTIEVDLGAPKKFELSQNYPNPFNPTTTISYNIPEATNVKLTIYNLLGQEIKTLVNEFKESGVHTINFDASELNSGLYIYKLQAGSFVQTRKMTLVK
jgi:hypothetical protein